MDRDLSKASDVEFKDLTEDIYYEDLPEEFLEQLLSNDIVLIEQSDY